MAVQVQLPGYQRNTAEGLAGLLKALEIGQGVANYSDDKKLKNEQITNQLDLQKQQLALAQQREDRDAMSMELMNRGVINPSERAKILPQLQKVAGEHVPGAFEIKSSNGFEMMPNPNGGADIADTSRPIVNSEWYVPVKQKNPDDTGLGALLKRLTAEKDILQIDEMKKKAGEIEGPKAQAAGYGKRMLQADEIMNKLSKAGYDRSGMMESADSIMPNALKSSSGQQQAQAERNFVNALLRRESGAAISKSEFDSAEVQYFPRSGDSEDTLINKAQNRAQAIASLKAEAGHAWNKVPLVDQQAGVGGRKGGGLADRMFGDPQKSFSGPQLNIVAPGEQGGGPLSFDEWKKANGRKK